MKPETLGPEPPHPSDHDLARLTEDPADQSTAAHVRDCARCHSTVADFRWLGGEIEAALAAVAGTVPVPRPAWWAVQVRVAASRRHQVARGWASACASALLAVGLMFGAPSFVGLAASAQAARAEAVVAPAPRPPVVTGACPASLVTPTPAVLDEQGELAPTPGFLLPPTPPDPGTPSG